MPPKSAVQNGQAKPAQQDQASSARRLEALIWLVSLALSFNFYNTIGELAKQRGVDYSHWIKTPADLQVPTMAFTILPYLIVYLVPIFYWMVALFGKSGLDLGRLRRAWTAQALMIMAGYAVFLLFPVSIAALEHTFQHGGSMLDTWAHQFVFRGQTRFCAFPSMHVGNAWLQSHIYNAHQTPGTRFVFVLTAMQFIATVGTRAHYLLDLPAGLILAELFARLVFLPLERRKSLERPGALSSSQLALFAVVPVCLWALNEYLARMVGWGGLANIFV